jgi:hypothetical protein
MGMETDESNPFERYMEDVVNQEFERQEREAAQDLLQYGYHFLPYELKELYDEVAELHRRGQFKESSRLFEDWMDQARELGLI